jgi:hypothetical protein
MPTKSIDQIWNEMKQKSEEKRIAKEKAETQERISSEEKRQKYLREARMYERAAAESFLLSSSVAGGTPCVQYKTINNTVWIYPQIDVDSVLSGTTYSYILSEDDIIFDNLENLVQVYLEIVNKSLVSQPIGNQGYSLGVGTKLRSRRKRLNMLISSGQIIVKWLLVEQITSQSDIPVGGDSPDGTIGYLTIYTDYPNGNTLPDPYLDPVLVNEESCV